MATSHRCTEASAAEFPRIPSMRERGRLIYENLAGRLKRVLPRAMRETGIDMWIILCQ